MPQRGGRIARRLRLSRRAASVSDEMPRLLATVDARAIALGLATVLGFLSALHVYWAAGGEWGLRNAIPEFHGRPVLAPTPLAALVVAAALAVAAVVPLVRTGVVAAPVPNWAKQGAVIALAAVFFVRAVGDFRFVGFFKRVHGTAFAFWDTRLFSPLCLLIALAFVWIARVAPPPR